MTDQPSLTDLAVDVVNRYDDEQLWNEFFSAWIASKRPVNPGHSAARMAAELLAAEVLRLRKSQWDTIEALSGEIKSAQLRAAEAEKRVQWYVDRDSLKAGNA